MGRLRDGKQAGRHATQAKEWSETKLRTKEGSCLWSGVGTCGRKEGRKG